MSGDVLSLTEAVGQELDLRDYVVHEYKATDRETGEESILTRLVVITTDGVPLACVSKTLLQSLKTLAFGWGPPPWVDGLKVTVRMKRKGPQVQIYWFEPKE